MRSVLLMASNNLKIMFSKRRNIFVYIFLPVFITLLVYTLFGGNRQGNTTLALLNNDKGILSTDFVKEIKKVKNFDVKIVKKGELTKEVADSNVDCGVVIPENFTENAYKQKIKTIKIYSIKGSDATAWIESYINLYMDNLSDIAKASNGNKQEFNAVYKTYMTHKIKLNSRDVRDVSNGKKSSLLSMGFIVMFFLSSAGVVANMILKDRKDRTYFRICCAPVTSVKYITANVLTNIAVVLTQVFILVIAITKVLNLKTYVGFWSLCLMLSVFGLVCVGLGLLIVAFCDNNSQASNLSTLIVTPTCMLGGCFWPIDVMPKWMIKLSDFVPQKWALDAIGKLQEGKSLVEVSSNIVILLAFSAVFFMIAVYRFKTRDSVKNIA